MKSKFSVGLKNNLIFIISVTLICLLVYIFRKYIYSLNHDSIEPSIELVIMIVGTLLTFLAFYVQYNYNKRQKEDVDRERFEHIYFNYLDIMVKLENSCSIPVVGAGKQSFHYMFYEYKCIFNILLESNIFKEEDHDLIAKHAFILFLNGVSYSSCARILEKSSEDIKPKIVELNNSLLEIQKGILTGENKTMSRYLRDYSPDAGIRLFDGHRLRIIPFIRHLCMFVQFIDTKITSNEDFTFYRDTLLAQMSEHEIALAYLCYNIDKEEFTNLIIHDKSVTDKFFGEVLKTYLQSPGLRYDDINFITRN